MKKYNDMTVEEHIELSKAMCLKNPDVFSVSGVKTGNLHKAMYRMIDLVEELQKELQKKNRLL